MTNSNSRKSRQRNLNLTTHKKTNPVAVQNCTREKIQSAIRYARCERFVKVRMMLNHVSCKCTNSFTFQSVSILLFN